MTEFRDKFGDVVRGLLSLEINTIIKPNMMATRMPSPAEAMHQVAAEYQGWLNERKPGVPPPPLSIQPEYFEQLRQHADKLGQQSGISRADALMVARIAANSAQLRELHPKLMKDMPDPDEVVQLRKIWEIGTEEIALQTVVYLDGDVVVRVRPEYASGDHAHLLAIHATAVRTSLSFWKSLTELVRTLFDTVWTQLTKGR
jgi:hypothetical protein